MIPLAYFVVGLSLSALTACQSEDTKVAQKPDLSPPIPIVELATHTSMDSSTNPSGNAAPAMPDFQAIQTELASLQQRLQATEASLVQSQAELSRKTEQLQALNKEQQHYAQQQISLDGVNEQIQQLEQQLSQKDQQLSQLESNLLQAESECQQAARVNLETKQIAELEPTKIER
ncbi:MAG: hypothetical protein RLZZ215_172 [Pseudomonadota bacterium]|jgi:DNA repair ATPase RecN